MRYLITVDCNRIYIDIGSQNSRGDFIPPVFIRVCYFDYKNAMGAYILTKMLFKCARRSDIPHVTRNFEQATSRERDRKKEKKRKR